MQKKKLSGLILLCFAAIIICTCLFYTQEKEKYPYEEKITLAMDTVITQKIYGEESAKEHLENIGNIINTLDETFSRFNSSSAVTTLNTTGKVTNSYVAHTLSLMKELSEKTEGVFDVTIGGVSSLWSFGEKENFLPSEKKLQKELSKVGSTFLEIEGDSVVLKSGAQVDLGAVGKGFACDEVKAYLEEKGVRGAIISVGGSIVAYGDYNDAGDKWNIAIQHPRESGSYLGVLSLKEGFVSTSGDYERYFEKDGVRYHHILDATTGYPASSDVISVTVIADSGILSDALSTACFILGYEKSLPLLDYYGAKAIFVNENLEVSLVGEVEFEIQ